MTAHQEKLIRERAYDLWEAEGRPEGASERHWQQAQDDIARANEPAVKPKRSRGKGSPAQVALADASAITETKAPPRSRRKAS
jgi:hypothetical protein